MSRKIMALVYWPFALHIIEWETDREELGEERLRSAVSYWNLIIVSSMEICMERRKAEKKTLQRLNGKDTGKKQTFNFVLPFNFDI